MIHIMMIHDDVLNGVEHLEQLERSTSTSINTIMAMELSLPSLDSQMQTHEPQP